MTKTLTNKNTLFLITLAVFLLSRGLTLSVFPIFNDEAIYLQYSQGIHDDWQKDKFISMNNDYADWKPPLQYWMAAPVIEWGNDPLLAGRGIALFVSFLGLIGFYLFAKEFFSQREAVLTAMLYTICPTVFFHNKQFTAETFLFSSAPFFYWALLKAMQSKSRMVLWAILAVLLGTSLLLLKQSGFLFVILAIVLPFARSWTKEGRAFARLNWKEVALNCLGVGLVIIFSYSLAELVVPAEFDDTRVRFNSRWVLSTRELFQLPMDVWRANLRVVSDYVGSYYSWTVLLFLGVFIWFAVRRKNIPELALAFMCLAGGVAVIFLLRGFNEYMINTTLIVFLLPLLARTGSLVWGMARVGRSGLVRGGLLICSVVMAGYWSYQIVLMSISPGKYIERSTPWAVANYLNGWPTGFGVKEIVSILEKETGPGVVFADPQWGNPRTALEIYARSRFPKLRIVPVPREFLDPAAAQKFKDAVMSIGPVRMVIFSERPPSEAEQWLRNVEQLMCDSRQEIRAYPGQRPIIVCSF